MTDIAIAHSAPTRRRPDMASDAAKARLRARYRREARFRAYGLGAIAVATLFLVVLLADILMRGLPAFTTHSLVVDIPVKAELIDPEGRKDAATIRAADYFPVTRDALMAAFPGLEGRRAERALTRLLSTGAADDLRDRLVADPGLIGTSVKVPLRLSAEADIYYKGQTSAVLRQPGDGVAKPDATSGDVTIAADGPAFAAQLVWLKQKMAERAAVKLTEARRLERSGSKDVAAQVEQLRKEAADLKARFDAAAVEETLDADLPSLLVAIGGGVVKIERLTQTRAVGTAIIPLQAAKPAPAGSWQIVTYVTPESSRKINDEQITYLERLRERGAVHNGVNWRFLTSGDSREPELAGIRGALVGTALTLFVTLALSLPIGVLAAIYLEEFAPKNRLTEIIEINISNLAAVPSIVFGLLGLAMFLNVFDLPRSAPLVGGLVLGLLVLPTIIIAARAALKAVPPSIKEAALGVGASHQQAVFHHVLPLATPGIMTGSIIGMAHALGETAPLLLIGMVAFIVDVPGSLTDAATVLPVQIYLWSDLPERAFEAKTAAAIIVLLAFLFVMNGMAIWLRKRFERRW